MSESPDGQSGDQADRPDGKVGEEFDSLRDSFRYSYQDGAAEGPSREEVGQAFRTLGGAITRMVAGAGNTLRDPAVKQQVKKTTRTVISTLVGVLSEWTSDLRSRLEERCRQKTNPPDGPEPTGADESRAEDSRAGADPGEAEHSTP